MKSRLIILTILAILLAGCQNVTVNQSVNNQLVEPSVIKEPEATTTSENESGEVLGAEVEGSELAIPQEGMPEFFDQSVAFISQAPYAVWDELHKEACEEAAMITVVKYFKNEEMNPHTMEQGILNLVKWQEANGYKVDLTVEEAVEILQNYFDFQAELVTEVTVDRIKEELAAERLIIIPAAGRQLDNPYFQTPGPIYHMLVVRGYDDKTGEFITNDVGTKRGEGFRYKYQKLIDVIHDWDHQRAENGMTDEEMEQGRKVMIIISN